MQNIEIATLVLCVLANIWTIAIYFLLAKTEAANLRMVDAMVTYAQNVTKLVGQLEGRQIVELSYIGPASEKPGKRGIQ